MKSLFDVILFFLLLSSPLQVQASVLVLQQAKERTEKEQEALRSEEEEDYFKKWLEQDVVYIIAPQEKDVFKSLTTPEEKEQFIEQFWHRRDLDLTTSINEFKEEHYRRIAYANERFASGEPGWMTDRGKIYIIHGPPDQIEAHPAGGPYHRPMHEGGGATATFPFEIWWYRHIEGIGNDIELEFVDRSFSGQYRLALRPEEKDALLYVNNAGQTLAEEIGLARKEDRPFFSPGNRGLYPLMFNRAKDDPFQRYETFSMVQRPKQIKYKDLKELVTVDVRHNNLPFKIRQDYFKLNDNQLLVPLTLEWKNKDLTFKDEGTVYVARLAIYGIITSLTNRIVTEFEEDVTTSFRPAYLQQGLRGYSLYQKIVPLGKNMRYKLDLVVKDLNSGNIGALRQAIIPPSFSEDGFSASSLMLADFVQQLEDVSKKDQMFILGDLWIRPSLSKSFSLDKSVSVYLQVYNAGIDQTTLAPSIEAIYRIFRGEKPVLELTDNGESVQYFSGQRVVLLKTLPIVVLETGEYRIEVQVRDHINDQAITVADQFQLTAPGS
ncbi:GWxTD domain-containing protein [Acidobacteria bacterium AH-259-O06]|nr:GWxTD domain-containing protein [Acidobacteria bacterium AH-259-O06]